MSVILLGKLLEVWVEWLILPQQGRVLLAMMYKIMSKTKLYHTPMNLFQTGWNYHAS